MPESCYVISPIMVGANMRKGILLMCVVGLLNVGHANACDIVDKQEIQVGGREGISGKCPNNSLPVQCVNEGDGADSLTCNGPEGSFDGSDLQDLISMACGCAAGQDNGATEQLNQELGE
jgi:hypothetical protein